jgi:hypothetical protein
MPRAGRHSRHDLHLRRNLTHRQGNRSIPDGEQASDWVRRYQRDGRPAPKHHGRRAAATAVPRHTGLPLSRVGWLLKERGQPAAVVDRPTCCAFVRDAPARAWRGPARDSDDARTRRSINDTNLYTRARGPAARRVRSIPSSAVTC